MQFFRLDNRGVHTKHRKYLNGDTNEEETRNATAYILRIVMTCPSVRLYSCTIYSLSSSFSCAHSLLQVFNLSFFRALHQTHPQDSSDLYAARKVEPSATIPHCEKTSFRRNGLSACIHKREVILLYQ